MMQRTLILGNCGAGKSTLARQLSLATGLPLIHLDQHYWKPDWQPTAPAQWEQTVAQLAARPRWIMDGNYGGTMDLRIERADTLIFLNYPTATCLWRITKRTLRYWRKQRPDMSAGCRERFDLDFYRYVATYNLRRRDGVLRKLDRYCDEKQVMVLETDGEATAYLKNFDQIKYG